MDLGTPIRAWRPPAQRRSLLALAAALAIVLTLAAVLTQSAQAQTYSVIYNFSGGQGGATPMAGLTSNGANSFYGTANYGGITGGPCGNSGCGMVYRLTNSGSGWALTSLYNFMGGADGQNPETANVVFGPDGGLYSSTFLGGGGCTGAGCGTVFKLWPGRGFSPSTTWIETILHRFSGADGSGPVGAIVFDHMGNLDGATNAGGFQNGGVIFQLNASSGFQEVVLFHPYGYPGSSVSMDHAGDLYGTTFNGGANHFGSIFKLTPSGSGYTSTDIYDFTNGADGAYPKAGVILDAAGNLYGATSTGGSGHGGTVFKLTFSNGRWVYSPLYSFAGPSNGRLISGPVGNLVMDSGGNLYGTTFSDGIYGSGAVFKLTPSNGSWTYTSLHDFFNGSDGGFPYSNLVIDTRGNLFGTASTGGAQGLGVVFQITP
jgi:uncharacterized repeat protein (TIGR03803 family)